MPKVSKKKSGGKLTKRAAKPERVAVPKKAKIAARSSEEVARPMAPLIVKVSPEERKEIMSIAKCLQGEYRKYDDPAFIAMLHFYAFRMLPDRILKIVSDFSTDFGYEQYGAVIFRGIVDVDQNVLGTTPETWREADNSKLQIFGFVSALIHAAAKAYPVQQYYQRQGGGILHSVIPSAHMENTQTGEGSSSVFYVHTEDANLTSSADFISFCFLRNEEAAPSMLHSVRSHDLCQPYTEELFEAIYKFPLDANYRGEEKSGTERTASVLFGNATLPFMRFDPAEQLPSEVNQTARAQEALLAFWRDAEPLIYQSFVPESGDLCLINNKLVSHGRGSFRAGYKRVNGVEVPCNRRWMLRMMSVSSLFNFYRYAHPENPYLGFEKHYDNLFEEGIIVKK